jgi:cytoskeleton protein RodZ
MSEESGGATAEAQVGPLTPGMLLRRERERRALSVQQAAEDLHLDTWMVEAIEADRFVALGAPVYAKGHLKKYAALLGLSPADVIQRYEALSDTPVVADPIPTTVSAPAQRERPSFKAPLWIVAALAAAALGVWLYQEFTRQPEAPVIEPSTPSVVPETTGPEATALDSADTAPAESPAPAAATATPVANANGARTESARAIPEPARAQTEPIATAAPIRLRIEFNDSSWTEIYDATGRRLMLETGAPGHVRTLSGVPPIRVNLGLASAVDLQVNDRPTVVPRRAGRDSVRFVIDADGVAR